MLCYKVLLVIVVLVAIAQQHHIVVAKSIEDTGTSIQKESFHFRDVIARLQSHTLNILKSFFSIFLNIGKIFNNQQEIVSNQSVEIVDEIVSEQSHENENVETINANPVVVPIIDISALINDGSSYEDRIHVAHQIGNACKNVGFFIIKGHGVPNEIINEAWDATRSFFNLPLEEKMQYRRPQQEYPFGYNELGAEILSAGKAKQSNATTTALPDLKEMFSLGPSNPDAGFPSRIFAAQPDNFEVAWTNYYDALTTLASKLFVGFSIALNLPNENFFEEYTTHHASALRALNYPSTEDYVMQEGQLRASAHTDYGAFTILRSDSAGLQVSKDKDPPAWHDVPYVEDAFVVNLGDLMQRWTNDEWLSTLHRVINLENIDNSVSSTYSGNKRRQSMAYFHNLNPDAIVTVLNSENPKYEPIVAGEFLMQKHLASIEENKPY
jgi:isopenicillin N synthase-like dioxygenase